MSRRWNLSLWLGFFLVLAGVFSYQYFIQFPATRDFPWVNLLLIGAGLALLAFGLFRAFGNSKLYRGKIFGSIMATISLLLAAFFAYGVFSLARALPIRRKRRASENGHLLFRCRTKTGKLSRWRICCPQMALS